MTLQDIPPKYICEECGKEIGVLDTIVNIPFINTRIVPRETEDISEDISEPLYITHSFCPRCSLCTRKEYLHKDYIPKFRREK